MAMDNGTRAIVWALCGCLLAPAAVGAETATPPRGYLVRQANRVVMELTSIKSSGRVLASDDEARLEALLERGAVLTANLARPEIEDSRLAELAGELSDLQREVKALREVAQ
jgi:uncharacterized protein involved in exopolysaccharide biosynthesis